MPASPGNGMARNHARRPGDRTKRVGKTAKFCFVYSEMPPSILVANTYRHNLSYILATCEVRIVAWIVDARADQNGIRCSQPKRLRMAGIFRAVAGGRQNIGLQSAWSIQSGTRPISGIAPHFVFPQPFRDARDHERQVVLSWIPQRGVDVTKVARPVTMRRIVIDVRQAPAVGTLIRPAGIANIRDGENRMPEKRLPHRSGPNYGAAGSGTRKRAKRASCGGGSRRLSSHSPPAV